MLGEKRKEDHKTFKSVIFHDKCESLLVRGIV